MSSRKNQEILKQRKERARTFLSQFVSAGANRVGVKLEPFDVYRKKSAFLKKAVLVTDPINVTLKDSFGGTFTCTYTISEALAGLVQKFQELEEVTDDELSEFAEKANISLDDALTKLAVRYVEAEIFGKLKAGRFLHEQLKPAVEQMLSELLADVYLQVIVGEYRFELIEPARTFEKAGREHTKHRKKRSGLVQPPGHPRTWTKEELISKVNKLISEQKEIPTLPTIASAMHYGGTSGGASALGKLLKRHSIDWKELKKQRRDTIKRT